MTARKSKNEEEEGEEEEEEGEEGEGDLLLQGAVEWSSPAPVMLDSRDSAL